MVFFRALEGFVWLNGFNANIGFMDAYGDHFNYKWLHKWLDSLITSLESLETPLMGAKCGLSAAEYTELPITQILLFVFAAGISHWSCHVKLRKLI